jgi:glycosyltransferase involved in cell wall biosynthesis
VTPDIPTPAEDFPAGSACDEVDSGKGRLTICMPVYNDWPAAQQLLREIDDLAAGSKDSVSIVLIDDGSTDPLPPALQPAPRALRRVEVVHLRRNVGHQRAIALGLCFIHETMSGGLTVVMDADGEDQPADIAALVECCRRDGERSVVFARRARRTEGLFFRAGYLAYRILHRLLVGRGVDVGNFSVVPRPLLTRIVGISELWNHYAAAVCHARLPVEKLPLARGRRLSGQSHMNPVSLVMHGLSAISVYSDVVGVRLLLLSALLFSLAAAGVGLVVAVRLFSALAIPGWATNAAGLLLLCALSALLLIAVFVQMILQSRNYAQFLPVRDWRYYVASHRTLHERTE